jgi:arabinofuranan 3-O-arabinosyltransferase
VTIEITDVESATTVDRRFGDVFVLPAAITEFEFAGAPAVARLGSATTSLECVPIARLDGDEVDVSIDIAGSGWLDGQALTTTSCTSILDLGAGTHRLTAIDAGVPIELDRVVLDDGVRAPDAAPDGVVATVTERSRFERTITVTGCDAGCWLVLGEGFNTAWAASVVGRDLGKPVLIDGGFNGWRLAPSASPVVVEVRWTVQRPLTLALWASVVTALLAIGLVANDLVRRRHAVTVAERVGPVIDRPDRLVGARRSVVVAAVWTLSGGVLIGPGWALAGAVAGAAVVATRRTRLPELTTIASVVTIGVGTAFVEWRDAPFPGGGWPAAFESLHGFGMFAMVSLLVAALTADDAAIVAVGRHDSGTDPVPVAGR